MNKEELNKLMKEGIYSIQPPETAFGFTYWSLMIPPFKPENILILGYGAGTIAGLIRKIWKDVDIMGVDPYPVQHDYRDTIVKQDANLFLQNAVLSGKKYDYVIIDIFDKKTVPSFVFSKEFMDNLSKVSSYMISLSFWRHQTLQALKYRFYFRLIQKKTLNQNKVWFFIC